MIKTVGIIGAGFMGIQIAFQLLRNKVHVLLIDISDEKLAEAKKQIASLAGQFKIEEDLIMHYLHESTELARVEEVCDLVIECTPEDIELKKQIFTALENYCKSGGILATNSSAILVSELEKSFSFILASSRILNMHFLPPVWERPLVEIMGGSRTTVGTIIAVEEFVKSVGLVPLVLKNENRGFVFNFIWQALKATCLDLADREIADIKNIDLAWKTGMGMKVGPFEVMDMVGLDVIEAVFKQHGQPVPKTLAKLIAEGKLGRKTGAGFYNYS